MKQAQKARGKHKQWNVNVKNNTNHKFNRRIVQTTKNTKKCKNTKKMWILKIKHEQHKEIKERNRQKESVSKRNYE